MCANSLLTLFITSFTECKKIDHFFWNAHGGKLAEETDDRWPTKTMQTKTTFSYKINQVGFKTANWIEISEFTLGARGTELVVVIHTCVFQVNVAEEKGDVDQVRDQGRNR